MKIDVFQALADPTRRGILILLASQAMTPTALAEHFEMTRQAVSKHIHVLRESQLLFPEKRGREMLYHLNPDRMAEIDQWIAQFKVVLETRFAQLDDILYNLNSGK